MKRVPDMAAPDGSAVARRLHYHDGSARTVYCREVETPFPDGHLIVSRVDPAGIITHGNEVFVAMSGWSHDELIGSPHHILRHPDMPRAAFADLWRTVQAGGKWHGWVKNLRKDGGFYWVYATVVPNVRQGQVAGYTSVRRKPSRRKVDEMSALYARMLAEEGAAP